MYKYHVAFKNVAEGCMGIKDLSKNPMVVKQYVNIKNNGFSQSDTISRPYQNN